MMLAASTSPRTCAYRLFQLEVWLAGSVGGRTELGKLMPPIVFPMKYCKVFCELSWPSSRWKYAQVWLKEPPKRNKCFFHSQLASSRRPKPWEFHRRVREFCVSMFTGTRALRVSPPGTKAAGVIAGNWGKGGKATHCHQSLSPLTWMSLVILGVTMAVKPVT